MLTSGYNQGKAVLGRKHKAMRRAGAGRSTSRVGLPSAAMVNTAPAAMYSGLMSEMGLPVTMFLSSHAARSGAPGPA